MGGGYVEAKDEALPSRTHVGGCTNSHLLFLLVFCFFESLFQSIVLYLIFYVRKKNDLLYDLT